MVLAIKILSLGYASYSKCQVHEETKCKLSTSHLTLLLGKCKSAHSFGDFEHLQTPQSCLMLSLKKLRWPIGSATGENGIDSAPRDSSSGGTRLARAIQDFQVKVDVRFKKFKENLPMKLLFFLVGFYCATAFATVIGQTGDWDILSAALAVVIVEGIGALMYRALPLINSLRNLIVMFNYWKTGLSLGLFLDSFKY